MTRRKKKKKSKIIILLLIIFSFIIAKYPNILESFGYDNNTVIHRIEANGNLYVYYIDVGEGDSILISNNNHNMLIDSGSYSGSKKLVKYIKEGLKIDTFDYIVATHPHEDHIGGMANIINSFNVKNIYMPDVYTTSSSFEYMLKAIENKNLEITIPEIDEEIILDTAVFRVLYTGTDTSDLNNSSIVLRMDFGNNSFLFTADATEYVENKLLLRPTLLNVDVLKVAHHGSNYSSTDLFLASVLPKYAVISVGGVNDYGHPGKETLLRLQKYNVNVLKTSELGTIILISDGENISLYNEKTETR